ncbi:MAG TPA: hypothetical protein VGA79_03335 [Desulfobaccales bacterium]
MAHIGATGEATMGYAVVGLKTKVLEIYPEIEKMKVIPSLTFDEAKKPTFFNLTKGVPELSTYIDKGNADRCMDTHVCVSLGVRVRQFLENFKERG